MNLKRRLRVIFRRLVASRASLRDCGYAGLSLIGTFCPCIRKCGSQHYQSLSEEETVSDHRQVKADRLGTLLMFTSLICFIGLMVKFSFGLENIETMDEYSRNLPLILYVTILELLICGASARTAALLYRQRRHVVKHPNEINSNAYVRVGPMSRATLDEPWGFSYRPSNDGLEALLVEDVYKSSVVAKWNDNFQVSTRGSSRPGSIVLSKAPSPEPSTGNGSVHLEMDEIKRDPEDENDMNESNEFETKEDEGSKQPRISNSNKEDLVEINLDAPSGVDEIGPKEKARLTSGYAIVAVNDTHGDVGLMQQELLTAESITMYCHCHLADPALDERDEDPDDKVFPSTIGAQASVSCSTVPPNASNVACIGLEDEEPQMMLRWLLCSFFLGWVSLLPVMLIDPHPQRPRQRLFREMMLPGCAIIIPLWIGMWATDVVAILLRQEILGPFYYYVGVHMVLAGMVVILSMRLQRADLEIVESQRDQRRAEVMALNDHEKGVKIRQFICEDAPPTLLRELLISNPMVTLLIGCFVSLPIFISQLLFPLKTERGKLAQTYVCLSFGSLIAMQALTVWWLWFTTFDNLPRLYIAGVGLIIWYPCLMFYCVCLCCSGHYAKRDLDLIKRQRQERGMKMGEKNIELMETRSREWELVFSL